MKGTDLLKKRYFVVAAFMAMFFILGLMQSEKADAAQIVQTDTSGSCTITLDNEGLLTIAPSDGISGTLDSYNWYAGTAPIPSSFSRSDIKKVVFKNGVKANTIMSDMFYNCKNLEEVDFGNFDTSQATKFDFIFLYCSSLKEIDMSGFDLSQTDNITGLFAECTNLEKINLSNVKTGNLVSAQFLFTNCFALKELDLSSLDFSTVNNFESMFQGCSSLEKLILPKNGPALNAPVPPPLPDSMLSGIFSGCSSLNEITFGNSYEAALFVLPKLEKAGKYNGEWLNTDTNESKTSKELASKSGALDPGTYVRNTIKKTVSFETKGGSPVDDQILIYGEKAKEPAVPTRDGGYKFEGWYLNGKKYDFDTPVEADTVLFARWSRPATYTLTYPDGSVKTTDSLKEAEELLNKWELIAAKLTSDELGQIMLNDWVKNSEIKIEETKIPKGYSADSVVTITKIDEDGVTIVNNKDETPEGETTVVVKAPDAPPAETAVLSNDEKEKPNTKASAGTVKKSSKPATVRRYSDVGTGDDSNTALLIVIMVTALGAAVGAGRKLKKSGARKILMLVVAGGLTISAAATITTTGQADENTLDTFTINKIDQHREPVEGAEFSIYAKPVMTSDPTRVDVKKVWEDEGLESNRPETITVDLLANDEKVDSVELSEKNEWKHSFTDLPKYKDGKEIMYNVEERKIEGYTSSLSEDADNSFVITNTANVKFKISKSVIVPVSPMADFEPPADGEAAPEQPTIDFYKKFVDSLSLILKNNDGKEIETWSVTGEELWNNFDVAKEKYQDKEIELSPGTYTISENFVPKDLVIPSDPDSDDYPSYYQLPRDFGHHHAIVSFTVNKDGKVRVDDVTSLVTDYTWEPIWNHDNGEIERYHWEKRTWEGNNYYREPLVYVSLEGGQAGQQSLKIRNWFDFLPPKWK